MNFRTTAIVTGLAVALGAGIALAQPPSGGAPDGQGSYQQAPYQQGPYEPTAGYRHHGIAGIIKSEVRAGRLSQSEGTLLLQKIRELRAARQEQRQAYGQAGGQPPMGQPQQPPH